MHFWHSKLLNWKNNKNGKNNDKKGLLFQVKKKNNVVNTPQLAALMYFLSVSLSDRLCVHRLTHFSLNCDNLERLIEILHKVPQLSLLEYVPQPHLHTLAHTHVPMYILVLSYWTMDINNEQLFLLTAVYQVTNWKMKQWSVSWILYQGLKSTALSSKIWNIHICHFQLRINL